MKKITEDYCDFETAKLLKEKGFDERTDFVFYYYEEDDGWTFEKLLPGDKFDKDKMIHCPKQALTMKWLREVHKLFVDVAPNVEYYIEKNEVKYRKPYYTFVISSLESGEPIVYSLLNEKYKSYEEACEAAIKYCLENLI